MSKQYLGDGVYAEFDGFDITITTENGLPNDPSNRIVLEPPVFRQLIAYEQMERETYERMMREKCNEA